MTPDEEAPFSQRHGYRSSEPEITVREGAPDWLRYQVLRIARDLGMTPSRIRQVVCRKLLKAPDPGNSSRSEIWDEARELLYACDWDRVYDVAEALYAELRHPIVPQEELLYEERLNKLLREGGVGWQMRSGKIMVRGSEPFEVATREASNTLARHGRPTAADEIHEALQDLSRRPDPDLSGAIQHAMAALECVAKDVSGESGATLGEVISRHAEAMAIRRPLDKALIKLWGYASQEGRHLSEGREPGLEEAELVVGVAAAVSVYLSKRGGG